MRLRRPEPHTLAGAYAMNAVAESAYSAEVFARPVSVTPPQLSFGNLSGQLQIAWAADHIGWRLQTQTNSLNTGLGTNWLAIPGSAATNQILIPLNTANGSVFFRLVYP